MWFLLFILLYLYISQYMKFNMKKIIYFLTIITISNISYANSLQERTLDQSLASIINNFGAIPMFFLIMSTVIGVFILGMAGFKLAKLGKDREVRGSGIIGRLIAGTIMISIPATIALFGGTVFKHNMNKDTNFYNTAIEKIQNGVSNGRDNCINSKGNKGACTNY